MHVDRRILIGGGAFVGSLAVFCAVTQLLPVDSRPRTTIADLYLPILELAAFVLTCLALRRNANGPYRWTWIFLSLWLITNLFADTAWGWYEVVLRSPLPSPSIADVGYLISYPLGFLTVVFATWKASGQLRTVESGLDAMMLTLGIGGLGWPLLLAPMLNASPHGPSGLISLAYPLGDLLVIAAFVSLLLNSFHQRPPRFLLVIWAAFLVQVVADSIYFAKVAQSGGYTSGGVLDTLWSLVFVLAAIAALMGVFPGAQPASAEAGGGLAHAPIALGASRSPTRGCSCPTWPCRLPERSSGCSSPALAPYGTRTCRCSSMWAPAL